MWVYTIQYISELFIKINVGKAMVSGGEAMVNNG